MIIVEPWHPKEEQAAALLRQSHALMEELFEPEENYFLDLDELCTPDIRFFVARREDVVLGTGALAMKDGYAEVKSMFVDPGSRGAGIADALMRQLEDCAREEGVLELRLETSKRLAAAVKLYARHGFSERGIFGDYQPNTSSFFMEKVLT